MECNEYLELGNELERENKILMACAVYLEAIKNSSGEHKEVVKKYVEILSHKISENNSERNHEMKQQLLEWKMEGRLACAIRCYDNIFNNIDGENWIDEDNAILYHCINIYYLEEKYSDFSLDIKNAGIEELKKWYYSLKYII